MMSKIAVFYWSGTGNIEAVANAVADGAPFHRPAAFTPVGCAAE